MCYNAMQSYINYRTDIEQIMGGALQGAEISATYHYLFANKFNYQPDFAIPELKIIIECDGEQYHKKWRDDLRDKFFREVGWMTLRFKGEEIRKNIDLCITKIKNKLIERRIENENKS